MERGSSKHGPRVDEQMAAEVRGQTQGNAPAGARAEEWHEPEPAGDDQPEATLIPDGERRGSAPAGMTAEEVEQRSELGRFLPMSDWPGDAAGLRAAARERKAPDRVLALLDRLPEDRHYRTVAEVWAALGHANETHRW
ncbi:DUF2795 domain-containing protein [Rhizomonospora bruguierae]|uniref:DUF2795 domain-containing protein n=1 Tax=Rhizomonospora bruguierae TaxID=1581705 RepID=UPI001BCC9045|nr:DUF2795 domain-containing protein [Micromonospora sp. NBRC 107566]